GDDRMDHDDPVFFRTRELHLDRHTVEPCTDPRGFRRGARGLARFGSNTANGARIGNGDSATKAAEALDWDCTSAVGGGDDRNGTGRGGQRVGEVEQADD